jgi:hypothetical protein
MSILSPNILLSLKRPSTMSRSSCNQHFVCVASLALITVGCRHTLAILPVGKADTERANLSVRAISAYLCRRRSWLHNLCQQNEKASQKDRK